MLSKPQALDFETRSSRPLGRDHWGPRLLNALPERARPWIARSCPAAREMVEERTSFRALEAMYRYDARQERGLWAGVWQNLLTVRATRNRLKLVRHLVGESLAEWSDQPEVRVASIACGSARAVIEAVSLLPGDFPPLRLRCCDLSGEALAYCRQLFAAQVVVHSHQLAARRVNVQSPGWALEVRPHVVEMVGLLDYFDFETALRLITEIHAHLPPGGTLIVGNICPHAESRFVNQVIGWNLIERQPDEFRALLEVAGFDRREIVLHHEPLQVHVVAVCRRRGAESYRGAEERGTMER